MSDLIEVRYSRKTSKQTGCEPSGGPEIPRRRDEAECKGNICRVGELPYHPFHNANIAIQSATETATSYIRSMSSAYRLLDYQATYLSTTPQNVLDSPKQYIEIDRPKRPVRSTGLRPIRSERRLRWKIVQASVMKNKEYFKSLRTRLSYNMDGGLTTRPT